MTLSDSDFERLANVLREYDLDSNDFLLSDAPSTVALRPPDAGPSWSADLVDAAPVASPKPVNEDVPLCIVKYGRPSGDVPAGPYLAVLSGDSVKLIPPQGKDNAIAAATLHDMKLVTQRRSEVLLTRDGVVVRSADREVTFKPGSNDLMSADERAQLTAAADDLVNTLVVRKLLERGAIDSSGALAGMDRQAQFFAAPSTVAPRVYGQPLAILNVLPGPALSLYAAPFDPLAGPEFRARMTQASMTDVPPGRYLLVLDLPYQVRLLSADGPITSTLVGAEPVSSVDGVALGCFGVDGFQVGC